MAMSVHLSTTLVLTQISNLMGCHEILYIHASWMMKPYDCGEALNIYQVSYHFFFSWPNSPPDCSGPWRSPVRSQRFQVRMRGLWIISSGCYRVLEVSLEHMWGWRSAGSWLFVLRPPSSSQSLPLSAAVSPAWKKSHSLCQGVPLCGYCSALQESEPQKSMKYRSIENTFQLQCCWNLQCLTWT